MRSKADIGRSCKAASVARSEPFDRPASTPPSTNPRRSMAQPRAGAGDTAERRVPSVFEGKLSPI
jgi:hypothetical protein